MFSPKFASSLLIISFSVVLRMNRDNNAQGGTVNCVVDSSNIIHPTGGALYENYFKIASGNINNYVRIQKEVSTSASNTNVKTVKLVGQPFSTADNGQIQINPSGYFTSSIKIQEIVQ